MNRILSISFYVFLWILSGVNSLYAQSDSILKKRKQSVSKTVDSEKNLILSNQSEEFQNIRVDQIGDSLRLLELKNEMLRLGAGNNSKRQALSDEQDRIRIKDSLRRILQRLKIDSLRATVSGFPVILSRDTLFYVFTKLGSYSPKERARVISGRIYKLAEDYFYSEDSMFVVPSELTTDISYGEETIISISEQDAIWMNSTTEKLAEEYKNIITHSIKDYKIQNSWQTKMKEILLAVLVLFLLILIIYSTNRFFRWIKRKIEKQKGIGIKGIKIRSYEFLDTERQVRVMLSLINFIRWILVVILIYLSLPILFGIFPWTGGLAGQLISYFLHPIKNILISIWDYLPNLFTIIVLVFFFRYFLRILRYFKMEIERGALKIPGFYIDWANPTYQIIRVLFLAFMLIVIFPYLPGSNSPVFKGVSVFLGVLFTFGSAGALGNIVSGLVLTYMRAYKIGDRVKIGDATGDVIEKSLLVTKIKTIKNEIISIPNTSVMNSHTTNFSAEAAERGLILHTSITIGYDTPWRQIHELLIKAALATDLIEKDPLPFVFQESLNDFYVKYQINGYSKIANMQSSIYSQLHQNIQDIFNEAGVEIMSSHYSNIRDGNKTTVPDEYLPKDYVAPSFRIKDTDNEDSH
ncbi:MAG TPA: mechanosensitive ion channel family protein [Puia sp.]|jgi:small-conductance mechanosensitive channel|nr:mechanosensitive ion channel family protein [Puia sp.]